jgi:hypothetical protein
LLLVCYLCYSCVLYFFKSMLTATPHQKSQLLVNKSQRQLWLLYRSASKEILDDLSKISFDRLSRCNTSLPLKNQITVVTGSLTALCRKSDPESKGKVENVVKYVKQNFLYNRSFTDIDSLNTEALAWLGRTANSLPHRSTKKRPVEEWEIEKPYLNHFHPLPLPGSIPPGFLVLLL